MKILRDIYSTLYHLSHNSPRLDQLLPLIKQHLIRSMTIMRDSVGAKSRM